MKIPIWGRRGLLAAGKFKKRLIASTLLVAASLTNTAIASVTVTDVLFNPTHMGKTQTTEVTVKWTNDNTAAGSFTVPIPADFSVENAGPCTLASSTLTCPTPAGATGETDQLSFTLKAEQISTANLTATGVAPSSGAATATYYIQASGAVTVTKEKTFPASDPVAGEEITFVLKPQVLSGDPIPAGATIVVIDKLPATAAEFQYVSHSPAGVMPPPSCAHNAGAHEVVCTYTAPAGGWTLAQLNAAAITVKGNALIAGDNLKNEAVVDVDPNNGYVDLTLGDNTDDVEFNSIYGGDLIADGSFPSVPVDVGSNHNLTIIYKNDGPLDATGNGTVSTIIPAGFTIGTLPAGCTNVGNGTIDGISGTRIDCTATDIAKNNQTSFDIPLTMPATPGTGNFPVLVTPPPGYTDHNEPNNLEPVPYKVVDPFSDLGLSKSKTPGGPQKADATITHSFTITNNSSSTQEVAFGGGNGPLRVIDWLRPEEIASGPLNVTGEGGIGWNCGGPTNDTDPTNGDRTQRVVCETTSSGTLAPGASTTLTFQTTLGTLPAGSGPIQLTNRACTGKAALNALGLNDAEGPQPADPNTGNDCDTAGGSPTDLYLTDLEPTVAVKKYVSTDGSVPSNDAQAEGAAPTLAADSNTLKWRIVITTPNDGQDKIATLNLSDDIPARVTSGSTWPVTATSIAVSGTGYDSHTCPESLGATGTLNCNFKDVVAGANIVVDITMTRPIRHGSHKNEVFLTSPDSILTATTDGALNDPAWVTVTPRYDPAVTTKTISKDEPAIGETVDFTITYRNAGYEQLPVGSFTLTDNINTDATQTKAAFEILSVTGNSLNCDASDYLTGAISCINTATLNAGSTRTMTIKARLKKPQGAGNELPSDQGAYMWGGAEQKNEGVVTLGDELCEWRESDTVSAACDDTAAKSNNKQEVSFKVKVPDFDMQVKIDKLHTAPIGVNDRLNYRLRMRNDGPSLAENASITMYLDAPQGYSLKPVLDGAAIKINNINNVDDIDGAEVTGGFTYKENAAVSCEFVEATTNPVAPPAVVCTLAGVGGLHLDDKEEVSFDLEFTLEGPEEGAAGPVRIGVPPIVCASELQGHESHGICGAAERNINGFDPEAEANGDVYGNNYEKVNDIIFPVTDLRLSKETITESPVNIGQLVEYQLTIGNKGSDTPSRIRVVDTLPTGFEWVTGLIDGVSHDPAAVVAGEAALDSDGVLTVSETTPNPVTDLQNGCYISNGVTSVTDAAQKQEITCNLEGTFPPDTNGDLNTVVVTLYARAVPGVYAGPYATDVDNTAEVSPGVLEIDSEGEEVPVSIDRNPDNNDDDSPVQLVKSSISGYVYHDTDDTGIRGNNPKISGVSIRLTGTDIYGNAVDLDTVTDNDNGYYIFDDLVPGTYTVTETQPAGWIDGKDTAGYFVDGDPRDFGSAGNDIISGINLPAGADGVEYNFGELEKFVDDPSILTASISGFVYHDADNDGIKGDDEEPISGVVIRLEGENGDVRETTTNADGYYRFDHLEPDKKYTLTEIQPSGWRDGKDTVGSEHTDDGATDDKFSFTPVADKHGENWNFGERKPIPAPVPVPVDNPLALLALILGMGWLGRRYHMRKHA